MNHRDECVRKLIKQSAMLSSHNAYDLWLKNCNQCLKYLIRYMKKHCNKISIGLKQKIVAWIVRLKGLKVVTRVKFSRKGSGLLRNRKQITNTRALYWEDIETVFKGRIATRAIINVSHIEPEQFLQDAKQMIIDYITLFIGQHNSVKVNTRLSGEFVSGENLDVKTFATPNYELFAATDLSQWYQNKIYEPLLTAMEEFQERDSGWALVQIIDLLININKYNPLHAGCRDIDVPHQIALKRATINVKAQDNACFFWSVVASLYPTRSHHVDQTWAYPHYTTVLRTDGFKLPMCIHQIKKFEKLNNISVNVFWLDNDERKKKKMECLPLSVTTMKRDRHVNLLLIPSANGKPPSFHFVSIQNLSRLVGAQLSKKKCRKEICDR